VRQFGLACAGLLAAAVLIWGCSGTPEARPAAPPETNALPLDGAAAAASVTLQPAPALTCKAQPQYRWLDAVDQPYSEAFRESYTYEQATVTVQFPREAPVFHGRLKARGLKPNFAYQIKLVGMPPAVWGEKATMSCLQRKLSGVVIDGAIRDVMNIRKMGFPAFASLITPCAGEPKGQGMIGVPIKIGGQYIRTGDWIIGDDDGVVVIPQERAVEVANRAQTVVEREEREMAEIEDGRTLGTVSELMRWEQLRKDEGGKGEGES